VVIVMTVKVVASLIPAIRVVRVEPMQALREE
jgi:ABC-type lipoprotein release transport system permease subunit